MTDYTNNYFRMMNDIGTGYEAARVIRKAEKDALMKADDWDGVKAWNQREEKEFPFPFSRGQMNAYRAWQNSTANESSVSGESILEVNDLPWAGCTRFCRDPQGSGHNPVRNHRPLDRIDGAPPCAYRCGRLQAD